MKKNLFFVSTRAVYPPYGGDKARVMSLLKVLSVHFNVHFIHLGNSSDEDINTKEFLKNLGVTNHTVVKYNYYHLLKGLILGTIKGLPLQVALYSKTKLRDNLLCLYNSGDIVYGHLVRSIPHIDCDILKKNLYFEMTDTISRNYSVLKKFLLPPLNFLIHYEEKMLINYEIYCAQISKQTFLVSENDIKYLKSFTSTKNISTTPLSLDFSDRKPISWSQHSKTILIIANFNSIQNYKGTLHFINDIFPFLRDNYNLQLKLIGNISKKYKNKFNRTRGVSVVGRVESLSTSLKDILCGVCPIQISAGTQNKILDYISFGIPVLATSRSKNAIDVSLRKYIYKCDRINEYINVFNQIINHDLVRNSDLLSASIKVRDIYSLKRLETSIMKFLT